MWKSAERTKKKEKQINFLFQVDRFDDAPVVKGNNRKQN